MTEKTYPPTSEFSKDAHVNAQGYAEMYDASIKDPDSFWSEHGKRVDWNKPFSITKNVTYTHPDVSIKWFEDGTLNVAANCVDRHLPTRRAQTAILWESDNPDETKNISYGCLLYTSDAADD